MRKDKIGKCEFRYAFDILSKPSGGCIFNTNMFCTSDVAKLDLFTFYCTLSGNYSGNKSFNNSQMTKILDWRSF